MRLTAPAASTATTTAAPPPSRQAALVAAWPLALLADAAYLHFCDATGLKAGPRDTFSPVTPTGQAERVAAAVRCCTVAAAGTGAAATPSNGGSTLAATHVPKAALSAYKNDPSLEEDVALHALAVERLRACAVAVGAPAVAARGVTEGAGMPAGAPAAAIAVSCVLPSTLALLAQQAAAMWRVVDSCGQA